MQVRAVTHEEATRCAQLIRILEKGRWDLSMKDIEELQKVKGWVLDLAKSMASDLQSQEPSKAQGKPVEPAAPAMKIKSMGTIGAPKAKAKKRK